MASYKSVAKTYNNTLSPLSEADPGTLMSVT